MVNVSSLFKIQLTSLSYHKMKYASNQNQKSKLCITVQESASGLGLLLSLQADYCFLSAPFSWFSIYHKGVLL